tara:strand:+ start:3179 stop:3349 length:171 start_codon:yes stop_codon:yes gene_type:complete
MTNGVLDRRNTLYAFALAMANDGAQVPVDILTDLLVEGVDVSKLTASEPKGEADDE